MHDDPHVAHERIDIATSEIPVVVSRQVEPAVAVIERTDRVVSHTCIPNSVSTLTPQFLRHGYDAQVLTAT
ncbi:hypothetical protein [Burkholderia sola]|uniref:hypothetical protein n=1 Tax=Burkholderia sola TaxID=2843302 RepID=UPI0023DE0557|nr:hypothetical protein [Burkholderia sola]MDF3080079.1 hypothetical protein [Burkholderia sola]